MLLPLAVGFIFLMIHIAIVGSKLLRGRRRNLMRHSGALTSSCLMLMYVLYIYLCKTVLDVFNCGPTNPPDGKEYLAVVFEECGIPGGTQMNVMPGAIAGLIIYVAGYPAIVGLIIWRNHFLMMEDQLLRAKGAGHDRLTNPHAYDLRKRFSRIYFQFKPDFVFWSLVIIFRKFLIALVSLMFNRNASFQLAACIIVLFVAYSVHVAHFPYLSPADGPEVIRKHVEASYTSIIHAKLRTRLAGIESRSRKRAHRNVLSPEGKIDAGALLGVLGGWLFNYNTVEQLLLFAAIIVCLMGIMYDTSRATGSAYHARSRDAITSVVLAVVISAILYFVTVVVTEIWVLWSEEDTRKKIARLRARGSSKSLDFDKELKHAKNKMASSAKHLAKKDAAVVGATDTEFNPLFINSGGAAGEDGVPPASLGDAISASSKPPPPELWSAFQSVSSATDPLRQSTSVLSTSGCRHGFLCHLLLRLLALNSVFSLPPICPAGLLGDEQAAGVHERAAGGGPAGSVGSGPLRRRWKPSQAQGRVPALCRRLLWPRGAACGRRRQLHV